MHFVLFNGPPRSGKDTAGHAVRRHFQNFMSVRWEKFSLPNKFAFAGMMNAGIDDFGNVDIYEETKAAIVPTLGVSYRQWQIDFSEKFMKPVYGNDIFGRLLLDRCKVRLNEPNWICPVSDCGFQVEADVLAHSFNLEKCLLITIRREGCSFEGDSREWVQPVQNMAHRTLYNNKSKEEFEARVIETVQEWLNAYSTKHNA